MKKIVRILLILSPVIIIGFTLYQMQVPWRPPLDPNAPQYTIIASLVEHPEAYPAPMIVMIQGIVHNKSLAGDMLFLLGVNNSYFRVNCSDLDINNVEGGMTVYLRGISYYDDPGKLYFFAQDIHIHTSYSLYLSIPGAVLVLIILFYGFKFKFDDFSFSRKQKEVPEDT